MYSCSIGHIWEHEFCHLGSKSKISETTEFLLKYATFWGGFFMFSWAKKYFFKNFIHCIVCTE